jgi:hypothetical protein
MQVLTTAPLFPTGETVGALETRSVAAKTLELLARTVPPMRQVLWPMLLGALMSDEFVHAAPVVCDLLLRIGAKVAAVSGVIALIVWVTWVMLDVKNLQSGFTLPY